MRVPRTFGFVDLSGFTAFTDAHGDEAAVAVLTGFRACVRSIASQRAVRVAKWLGDGAMFVASDGPALVAATLDLVRALEQEHFRLALRGGLAAGEVILLEGDDYTGGAVNLAARLCDVANPGDVLVTADVASLAPDTALVVPAGQRTIAGLAAPVPVFRLRGTGVAPARAL